PGPIGEPRDRTALLESKYDGSSSAPFTKWRDPGSGEAHAGPLGRAVVGATSRGLHDHQHAARHRAHTRAREPGWEPRTLVAAGAGGTAALRDLHHQPARARSHRAATDDGEAAPQVLARAGTLLRFPRLRHGPWLPAGDLLRLWCERRGFVREPGHLVVRQHA